MILIACGAALASGCVYRMNLQQGNFLSPSTVAQLKEGMTRSQVRFLLGTPMVPDAFDEDRWDYYYSLRVGRNNDSYQQRVTVFFAEDKVARFEKVGVLSQADAERIDAELRKAAANNSAERKKGFWKRLFTRETSEPVETGSPGPGPVPPPPPDPAPAPAGTPSGPS